MVNTVNTQTLVDGSRNLVVKVDIVGDGSGEETATALIDASAYTPASTDIKIMKATSSLSGFSALLLWDATANVEALNLSEGDSELCYKDTGGLINNAGAGKTGDILVTTTGLGSGDAGTILLYMKKKN